MGGMMVIEHRAYTMKPGLLGRFYELQVARGFDGPMSRIMRDCLIGYFATASGPTEQLVHLYSFDDLEDWRERLHGLYPVPELQPYFAAVRPLMLRQESKFLAPAPIDELSPLYGEGRDWRPGDGILANMAQLPGMLVEERTLSLVPGALPAYWDACRAHAMPALSPLLPNLIGTFYTLVGKLHEVVSYWHFDDYRDRRRRHDAVTLDPRWQTFNEEIRPLVVNQESKLMTPAPVPEMSPLFTAA